MAPACPLKWVPTAHSGHRHELASVISRAVTDANEVDCSSQTNCLALRRRPRNPVRSQCAVTMVYHWMGRCDKVSCTPLPQPWDVCRFDVKTNCATPDHHIANFESSLPTKEDPPLHYPLKSQTHSQPRHEGSGSRPLLSLRLHPCRIMMRASSKYESCCKRPASQDRRMLLRAIRDGQSTIQQGDSRQSTSPIPTRMEEHPTVYLSAVWLRGTLLALPLWNFPFRFGQKIIRRASLLVCLASRRFIDVLSAVG